MSFAASRTASCIRCDTVRMSRSCAVCRGAASGSNAARSRAPVSGSSRPVTGYMPCRSCRPIVNARLPPPLIVRAPQGAVGVQAHQQPRARVLELVRVQGAGVLDQVVFRLVPGRLIHGVRDAAHRLPNQPHVLCRHVPCGDRGRQCRQFRWQLLPGGQRPARDQIIGQRQPRPRLRRGAVQQLPQQRRRRAAAMLLRQTPRLHLAQSAAAPGGCLPVHPVHAAHPIEQPLGVHRGPVEIGQRTRTALEHAQVSLQLTVQLEFGDHEEMLDPATDNFGPVHRAIARVRVKQFLTLLLWIKSSQREFLSHLSDNGSPASID